MSGQIEFFFKKTSNRGGHITSVTSLRTSVIYVWTDFKNIEKLEMERDK